MSGDGLFHIDEDGTLVSMTVTPYEAESLLQKLLESHSDLLAGGQMTPEAPRRWLLVRREQGVPDREDSGYRWSVDHLFVDQDAVPTLVEVKRSSDTRIRREVVGQMLDYAANGVRYWPVADLQAAFEATQQSLGNNPEDAVQALCDDRQISVDSFFARVGDNLRSGRIRMVFVADVIPDELMRITEFLNEQMSPAQVFAVEVKQYRAGGYPGTVIVPAVYGRTAAASVKTSSARNAPDREAHMAQSQPATLELLNLVDAFADEVGLVVERTPAGNLLKTPGRRSSIATVYLAKWDCMEVPIGALRESGWDAEADTLHAALQRMTSKRLTPKAPNVPSADALAHWGHLREQLLTVARLRLSEE